ncbi:hypothetical protein [Phascolarctobacterium succinatutens]|uniref:Intracellular proteinase inhibitor BsuPI domain-containing protein n=1 Tax=Phascolarctobacterium succinatutens TaxID=626940 RepID=A0A1Q6RB09_9FIRM|nr:hypothetical protein [Phascolarctobacterium succinatutens]OLA39567.1 MAG: hypothetical protein BHW43_01405 [Phascolarctobacterium succinatutens]
MRRTALICSLLLSLAGSSFAAAAEEMWQDYQQKPAIISNNPTKQAEPPEAESSIDSSQAEERAADNNIGSTAPTVPATPKQEEAVATEATAAEAPNAAATPPVVSNEPVPPADKPKPKPKLNLVGKPPLPRQFMRTPQASDFISVSSEAGGYSMAVPKAFGKNSLADLPQAEGAMLVRTAGNNLMLAATVLDPADTASFKATEALPVYENAKVYWQWQHGSQLIWNCRLSAHNDYHGNKLLLTAEATQNGKTYQLLYVMPAADNYLPQALYSLDSFKINLP